MKQRILLGALAFCLSAYSLPTAHAWQGSPSLQEGIFTEETTSEPLIGDRAEAISEEAAAEEVISELLNDDSTEAASEEAAAEEMTSESLSDDSMEVVSGDHVLPAQEEVMMEESVSEPVLYDSADLTPSGVYEAMIALKSQDAYKEGTVWTDYEPYSDNNYYRWKGGTINGSNIVAVGCVAFAFSLSDAAFGALPARMYSPGEFKYEDIKTGDILRVNTDTHTVIVLEVSDAGVIVTEGNLNGKVHWGRAMSRDEVMRDTSHYITRYPEGYTLPDDPEANETVAAGTLTTGLTWTLTGAGTLTISGNGAMPDDFSGPSDQPWSAYSDQIRKIVIADGVISIGSSAFYGNAAVSMEISGSVESIGSNAFYGCSLIYASIPSGVKTIGDDAFRQCPNLTSVTVSEGVESIGERAFRGCGKLTSVDLPASVTRMGAGAFYDCTELSSVTFASGGGQVTMGDNLFTRCWKLFDVTLPDHIDNISAGMFQNCYAALYSVKIPQGAAKIGASAFASCSVLTSIVIPDSITEIEMAAFSACNSLTDIYFTGTEAQWKAITKTSDVTAALSGVTIHYEYSDASDPGNGEDDRDPGTGEGSGTTDGSDTEDDPGSSGGTGGTDGSDPAEGSGGTDGSDSAEGSGGTDGSDPAEGSGGTDGSDPAEGSGGTDGSDPAEGSGGTDGSDSTGESGKTDGSDSTGESGKTDGSDSTGGSGKTGSSDSTGGSRKTGGSTSSGGTTGNTDSTSGSDSAVGSDPSVSPTAAPTAARVSSSATIPDTGSPFVQGGSGRKGWEAIKEDAVNASEGTQITVDMNGASVVPGEVIDSIKGKNVTLVFDMDNGLMWFVNGEDVTEDHAEDVDLSVQAGTSAIPQELVERVAGDSQTTQLSLAYSGYFGYNAVLRIDMGLTNAGSYANLFYYNESADRLEYVTSDQIDESGIAELAFSHASEYVVVVKEEVMDESAEGLSSGSDEGSADGRDSEKINEEASKTDEPDDSELQNEESGWNAAWLWVVGVLVIVAGIMLFTIRKKVDKKDESILDH